MTCGDRSQTEMVFELSILFYILGYRGPGSNGQQYLSSFILIESKLRLLIRVNLQRQPLNFHHILWSISVSRMLLSNDL